MPKRKGKKSLTQEESNQTTEINSLPIQSRRETRNSTKASKVRKRKESSCTTVEDNKQKLKYVSYLFLSHYDLLFI